MPRELTKEALEELKAWRDDPRGGPFWETLQDMARDGIVDIRGRARTGDAVKLAYFAGHVDTVEEINGLVGLIIENHAQEAREEKPSA